MTCETTKFPAPESQGQMIISAGGNVPKNRRKSMCPARGKSFGNEMEILAILALACCILAIEPGRICAETLS